MVVTRAFRRPQTVGDIQAAVRLHRYVQANGEGHSWNQPLFCAINNNASDDIDGGGAAAGTSANIQLTTLRPLKISVNETEESVTVDAGLRSDGTLHRLSFARAHPLPN